MDIAIAVLLGSLQAIWGLAGNAVSLGTWSRRARLRFAAFFSILSIAGIGVVAWQAVRASQSSEESKKTILGDAEHPPFLAVISLPGFARFVATNGSDYPAYGIRIQVYDDAAKVVVRNYNYPEMAAHVAFVDDKPWMPPEGATKCHFTASITTRTGLVYEELILLSVPR